MVTADDFIDMVLQSQKRASFFLKFILIYIMVSCAEAILYHINVVASEYFLYQRA